MSLISFFLDSRSASSQGTTSTNDSTQKSTTHADAATAQMSCGHTSSVLGKKSSDFNISSVPELKQMVVMTGVNDLLSDNHFSICKLRKIADVVGAPQHGPAWDLLSALHCVNYSHMPDDLIQSIPHLINECLRTRKKTEDSLRVALDGVTVV